MIFKYFLENYKAKHHTHTSRCSIQEAIDSSVSCPTPCVPLYHPYVLMPTLCHNAQHPVSPCPSSPWLATWVYCNTYPSLRYITYSLTYLLTVIWHMILLQYLSFIETYYLLTYCCLPHDFIPILILHWEILLTYLLTVTCSMILLQYLSFIEYITYLLYFVTTHEKQWLNSSLIKTIATSI